MPHNSVVVVAPVRTAIGTFGGCLKEIPAPNLGAVVIKAAVARAGLDPEEVGTAVMGNVIQAGTNEPGPPSRDPCRSAGLCPGDDPKPRLRLGRAGDHLGIPRDHVGHG